MQLKTATAQDVAESERVSQILVVTVVEGTEGFQTPQLQMWHRHCMQHVKQ